MWCRGSSWILAPIPDNTNWLTWTIVDSSSMMTSSNGNIFRVTGLLCGEFTGHRWHRGQLRGALMFCLVCAWINDWVNNREAGDLRRHRAHYDVIEMIGGAKWHSPGGDSQEILKIFVSLVGVPNLKIKGHSYISDEIMYLNSQYIYHMMDVGWRCSAAMWYLWHFR